MAARISNSTLEAHMPPDHLNIYNGMASVHQLGGKGRSEHDFGHSVIPEQICRRAAGLQIRYGIIEADGQYPRSAWKPPAAKLFLSRHPQVSKHYSPILRSGQDKPPEQEVENLLHLSIRFHTGADI